MSCICNLIERHNEVVMEEEDKGGGEELGGYEE